MKVLFGGTASLDLFTTPLDIPDELDPETWARTEAGRKAIAESFAEYFYSAGRGLRDMELVAVDYAHSDEDGEPLVDSTPFVEPINLEDQP